MIPPRPGEGNGGAWLGAILANRLPGPVLRLCFGVFVVLMGFYLIWGALKRLGWI